MTSLIGDAVLGLAIVAVVRAGVDLLGVTSIRGHRVPGGAIALWLAMALTSLAQVIGPGLLGALDEQPAAVRHHGELWRVVTAAFVQDGGPAGTIFNLVTLALIGVLADWYWGPGRMLAIFLGTAVLLDAQAAAFGVDTAGSSGATFALGASLVGVLIRTGSGPARGRAITVPLLGIVLIAAGNFHGLALLYGTVIGLATRGRRGVGPSGESLSRCPRGPRRRSAPACPTARPESGA